MNDTRRWTLAEVAKFKFFMLKEHQFDWRNSDKFRFSLEKREKGMINQIEKEEIEYFYLCDDSAWKDSNHFWRDAVAYGIPNMLSWLFVNSRKLRFGISCYIEEGSQVLIFTSSTLLVNHFYDLDQSVLVLCNVLRKRIDHFMVKNFKKRVALCTISSFRLNVNRTFGINLSPPLKYKCLLVPQKDKREVRKLNIAMLLHYRYFLRKCFPTPVKGKLYAMIQDPKTRAVSTLLLHDNSNEYPNEKTKNYLLMTDALGHFVNLLEITDPLQYREEEEIALCCERCKAKFTRRSSYDMHQKLKCDEELRVEYKDADYIEFFEHVVPITSNTHDYSWHATSKCIEKQN